MGITHTARESNTIRRVGKVERSIRRQIIINIVLFFAGIAIGYLLQYIL